MHVNKNTKDSRTSDFDEPQQLAVFDADLLESCENASTEQSLEELPLETKAEVDSGTIGFEVENIRKSFGLPKKNQIVQYNEKEKTNERFWMTAKVKIEVEKSPENTKVG